ncbi:MAG: DUF4240 domain-containing protein [Chitinophagaceae bacterium]
MNHLTKTAEMIEEKLYWQIVAESLKNSNNQADQSQNLVNQLIQLNAMDIVGFKLRTDQLLFATYLSDIWCAGYLLNRGCSADGFENFRNWIISRGKDVYYKGKENPDSLVDQVEHERQLYEFEEFFYLGPSAFDTKTGQTLYDYIDEDNFIYQRSEYPDMVFTWHEEQPNSIKKICPKLFAKLYY